MIKVDQRDNLMGDTERKNERMTTKDAAVPQFRIACSNKWCVWKTAANPHSMTSWWVAAAAADSHSVLRDGLMLEIQEQCYGFLKFRLEDRSDRWATVPANFLSWCVSLSWPPWSACHLLVSLNSPLCCSESEDSSDLNSWIYSSNSLCFVMCSFVYISCSMCCTLSLTVCKCTPCQ